MIAITTFPNDNGLTELSTLLQASNQCANLLTLGDDDDLVHHNDCDIADKGRLELLLSLLFITFVHTLHSYVRTHIRKYVRTYTHVLHRYITHNTTTV